MGMLDLFQEWLDQRSSNVRGRRRSVLTTVEELETRQVLSPMLTGTTLTVDGTASADVISVGQDNTGVTVVLNGTQTHYGPGTTINTINVHGLAGNDQISILGVFSTTTLTVDGGADSNTLISNTQANSWIINGPNSGTLNGDAFTNIQNLTGGGFNDNFRFAMSGFVSGSVDGDGGLNTLDYSTRNVGALVNLATTSATAIGGHFANITDVHGSNDNTDKLIGANGANVWNVTTGNAGNVNNQVYFSGVENLTGGTSADQFIIGPTGFVQGTISGGLGSNLLDYSTRTATVVTNLQTSTSTAIGTAFNQIGTIVGSASGGDQLTGYNQTNVWSISSPNAGTLKSAFATINFQSYENLVGGTVTDTFKLADTSVISGNLSGGGGTDTIDYSARTTGIQVNLKTSTSTAIGGVFSYIEGVVGSQSTTDQLIGTDNATAFTISGANAGNVNGTFAFSSIENLSAGRNDDSFRFQSIGFLSGTIDGGLGINTIDYSKRTGFAGSGVTVNLQKKTATGVGAFVNVDGFVGTPKPGGSSTLEPDTVIGSDKDNQWSLTGADKGTVTNGLDHYFFSAFENLTGGLGVDVFHVAPGASISGTINGGPVAAGKLEGGDWLDYSDWIKPTTVDLSKSTASNIGKVINVQNVHGGHEVNTLTGNDAGNILVGGESDDVIVGGAGRSLLIGGLGSDTVTGGSAQDIVIGTYSKYDDNLGALSAILTEWQSATAFQTRVNHLRAGVGINQSVFLQANVTVYNDTATDVIKGGKGPNWLWGQPAEFKDQTADDLTDVPVFNVPLLTNSSAVVFNIGKGPVLVDPAIKLTSTTAVTMQSATIKISSNYDPTQDTLAFSPSASTGNIKGSFDKTTGTMTLTSAGNTATVAQFQLALRGVSYYNNSATPSGGSRSFTFLAFDGVLYSNTLTSSLTFNSVPVLSGSSTITVQTLQAPAVINSVIAVSDADDLYLTSATVTITQYYKQFQDILSFTGNASTGDIVGSFDFNTGSLTLRSAGAPASVAQYQAALRLVTYQNNAVYPLQVNRQVSYQVSDASSSSNIVNSTIKFI